MGVEPGGPAADAGLQPGDLILEIEAEPVASVATWRFAQSADP